MNYEKFLRAGLVKRQRPDFKQIEIQLERAGKDLDTARANLAIDLIWTFAIAYHAMMRASKSLMYSQGYLPTSEKSHKTIVEFTKLMLGAEYENLIARFNRMRRQRHDFVYGSQDHITPHDAKLSLETAEKLIKEITGLIARENTEKTV